MFILCCDTWRKLETIVSLADRISICNTHLGPVFANEAKLADIYQNNRQCSVEDVKCLFTSPSCEIISTYLWTELKLANGDLHMYKTSIFLQMPIITTIGTKTFDKIIMLNKENPFNFLFWMYLEAAETRTAHNRQKHAS